MAKEVAKTETQTPRLVTEGGLPAYLNKYKEDIGRGYSEDAADRIVPMVRVLQALSPQLKRNNPAYIEGAKEGDIYMRGAPTSIVPGEIGFKFQPCYQTKHVVEWIPREQGGGFVARHSYNRGETFEQLCQRLGARQIQGEKFKYSLGQHELIETRYHIGHVVFTDTLFMPFAIPFTGSGHTVSRTWTTMLDRYKHKGPTWLTLWLLTSAARRNVKGEWSVLNPTCLDDESPSEELYLAGRRLHDQMAAGDKQLEDEDTGADSVVSGPSQSPV